MIQDSFWSHDYITGIGALSKSLEISIAENKQFLFMVSERARIENQISASLAQLSQEPMMHAVPIRSGTFVSKSSSLQSALSVFTAETVNNAVLHTRIASELDRRVRAPLQKWCDMYARRVQRFTSRLKILAGGYDRLLQAVQKQRSIYYENCHKMEDSLGGGSPRDPIIKTIRLIREKLNPPYDSKVEHQSLIPPSSYTIAGLVFRRSEFAELLRMLLADVTLTEYRVPLLGSYKGVSSGSVIAAAARKHLRNDSFAYAEKFGQALVDLGFLKPVGQISNRFQSLHNCFYQWQESSLALVEEFPDQADTVSPSATSFDRADGETSPDAEDPRTPPQSIYTNSNDSVVSASESTLNATDPSEEQYLQAVLELDKYRCDMEVEIMGIYQHLDRLERDREEAIKRGMHDFILIAFRPEDEQGMRNRLSAAQSQLDPTQDLSALVTKHKTGPFVPVVTTYHGYFNGDVVQTFGVDLDHSKFFVDIVLQWLRALPTRESLSLSWWTQPEPIEEIYKLRNQINNAKPFAPDAFFKFFTPSVVIGTFRQYLLELPESLVPFIVYERFKQLYSDMRPNPQDLATVFVQIPQLCRDTLMALLNYLRDSFKEEDFPELAASLALPLVRPRAPSAVTMDDRHPQLLVLDLLRHGPAILEEASKMSNDLKEAKSAELSNHPRAKHAESPTPSPPGSQRLESNNVMRPLSLSIHASSLPGLIGDQSPPFDKDRAKTGPGNRLATPSRGLGISPMLPLALNPSSSRSTHSSSPMAGPQSPTPHRHHSRPEDQADELKLPKVRVKKPFDD